ncbi:hypothetical protein CKO25_04035 [Thiocapsa imhoffii]|uniref:Uncharacterized protein n=1 Tax=Thiocapsa imhoffii TaxID=382777 RepID=A0A9X0WFX6_9GAMM|nr:hypothetical protein [Thiocapsa imhoffii]MBK1643843.1 hypothetical protein [Thiocapsa imhoffii]
MDSSTGRPAIEQLIRNIVQDRFTIRFLWTLLAFDLAFMTVIAARAFGLIWFVTGTGYLVIATQLSLVTLVLLTGWWRCRCHEVMSLVLVSTILVAAKLFQFHNLFGISIGARVGIADLDLATTAMIAVLTLAALLGLLMVLLLAIAWRRGDRQGRPILLLIGAALALTATASLAADIIVFILTRLTSLDPDLLERAEQGVELISATLLLTLTVGAMRVSWRPQPRSLRSRRSPTPPLRLKWTQTGIGRPRPPR